MNARRILAIGTLLSLMPLGSPAQTRDGGVFGSNLLSNPSFEDYYTAAGVEWQDGDIVQYALQTNQNTGRGVQPWINAGYDLCSIRTDGGGSGASGDFFGMGGRFSGGTGQLSRMRQDIDLLACGVLTDEIDAGLLATSVGGYLSSWPGDSDSAGFTVTFRDADLGLISTAYSTGQQDHDSWTEYRLDDIPVPTGTRFIQFDAEFVKAGGSNNDGRLDDAWVRIFRSTIPLPEVGRNLLANHSFEACTGGWEILEGNPRARLDGLGGVPARSGSFYLFGGQHSLSSDGSHADAFQEILLNDYGFTPELIDDPESSWFVDVGGWLYSWGEPPLAQAKFTCDILDLEEQVLASYDSGRVRSAFAPLLRRAEIALPIGARKIVFSYNTFDPAGANNVDGYLDDAFVQITESAHCRTVEGPLAIAHRGNSIVAPENTGVAIAATGEEAQSVEFDVRQCASGELVVIHDETVDRTTDGTGNVADMTLAELQALDAGSWFSPDFAGEPIPTLAEAIEAVPPGAIPLIERKTGSASTYVSELLSLGVEHDVVLQSFDWDFLADVNALDDEIQLAALGGGALTLAELAQIQATNAEAVVWEANWIGPDEVQLVHDAGLSLFVWTVNDPNDVDAFIALDVDGIVSDDPAAVTWRSDPFGIPGDLDIDGDVDLSDLAQLLASYGTTSGASCHDGDIDGDGDVDLADLGALLAVYGTTCP
jgi:glycerophosphoryl diester phosphodiesterase